MGEFFSPPASWSGHLADFDRRIFGRDAWSSAIWKNELCAPDRVYIACVGEADPIRSFPQIIGIAGARCACDAEILTVSVAPNFRRQGIARRLVTYLISAVRSAGAERVLLEVRAADTGAQQLYRTLGFEELSRRRGYYSDDDAIVMLRSLSGSEGDSGGHSEGAYPS